MRFLVAILVTAASAVLAAPIDPGCKQYLGPSDRGDCFGRNCGPQNMSPGETPTHCLSAQSASATVSVSASAVSTSVSAASVPAAIAFSAPTSTTGPLKKRESAVTTVSDSWVSTAATNPIPSKWVGCSPGTAESGSKADWTVHGTGPVAERCNQLLARDEAYINRIPDAVDQTLNLTLTPLVATTASGEVNKSIPETIDTSAEATPTKSCHGYFCLAHQTTFPTDVVPAATPPPVKREMILEKRKNDCSIVDGKMCRGPALARYLQEHPRDHSTPSLEQRRNLCRFIDGKMRCGPELAEYIRAHPKTATNATATANGQPTSAIKSVTGRESEVNESGKRQYPGPLPASVAKPGRDFLKLEAVHLEELDGSQLRTLSTAGELLKREVQVDKPSESTYTANTLPSPEQADVPIGNIEITPRDNDDESEL